MWISALTKVATNKYFIFGIIIAGLITYYEIRTLSYKNDILTVKQDLNDKVEEYNELNLLYLKSQSNLTKVLKTNKSNLETCIKIKKDYNTTNNLNKMIIIDKDNQIKKLIQTIEKLKNLPDPEVNGHIVVKDCKIYKGVVDDEIKNISNIGF